LHEQQAHGNDEQTELFVQKFYFSMNRQYYKLSAGLSDGNSEKYMTSLALLLHLVWVSWSYSLAFYRRCCYPSVD